MANPFKVNSDLVVGGIIDLQNNTITNIAAPVNATDVASKDYVDVQITNSGGAFSIDANNNIIGGSGAGTTISALVNDAIIAGTNAGQSVVGDRAIVIGFSAGDRASSSAIAIGDSAMSQMGGTDAIAIGHNALTGQTTSTSANYAIAIGSNTMNNVTGGQYTIAIGRNVATTLGNVQSCVYIGDSNSQSIATGGNTVTIGATACQFATDATDSVVVGAGASKYANAAQSVVLGSSAVSANNATVLDHSIMLGYSAGPLSTSYDASYQMFVDVAATDTPLMHGNFATKVITVNGDLVVTGNFTSGNAVFAKDINDNLFTPATNAGTSLTSGSWNFLAGVNAGSTLTSADGNVFIGLNAGQNVDSHPDNVAIGTDAMRNYLTGFAGYGFNVAIGPQAMQNLGSSTTLSVAVGRGAMENVNGGYDVAVGPYALNGTAGSNANSTHNTALGHNAGNRITTAYNNVFVGSNAASYMASASRNVVIGDGAGMIDGVNPVTGNDNVIIGRNAAVNITGGNGNVIIGQQAGPVSGSAGAYSNKLYIHNAASDTPLIAGDFATGDVTINGNLTVTGTSNLYQDLGEFTLATLPPAASNANSYALVTDAAGGRTVVRSDGTNWKIIAVEGATVA